MNVKIVSAAGERPEGVPVEFVTQFGSARGLWRGGIPQPSRDYDVEFELEDELIWGKSISETEENRFAVFCEGDKVILQGKLEAAEADGFGSIRIKDSVVLFEASGRPASPGVFVRIVAPQVILYDARI
jgi:hypothetical protein